MYTAVKGLVLPNRRTFIECMAPTVAAMQRVLTPHDAFTINRIA